MAYIQRTGPIRLEMSDNVDLNFLARLCQQTLTEVASMRQEVGSLRKEMSEMRTLVLHNVDYTRRMDRRMSELKDELELLFKAEIGGRFSNLERQVENMLAPLVDRIETLETR